MPVPNSILPSGYQHCAFWNSALIACLPERRVTPNIFRLIAYALLRQLFSLYEDAASNHYEKASEQIKKETEDDIARMMISPTAGVVSRSKNATA